MDVVTLALAKKFAVNVAAIGGTLSGIEIDANGDLIFTYAPTSGSPVTFNAGQIPAGKSVQTAEIDENGHLILTLDDGTSIDCGTAKGEKGDKGDPGQDGKDGASDAADVSYTTQETANPLTSANVEAALDELTERDNAKLDIIRRTGNPSQQHGFSSFKYLEDGEMMAESVIVRSDGSAIIGSAFEAGFANGTSFGDSTQTFAGIYGTTATEIRAAVHQQGDRVYYYKDGEEIHYGDISRDADKELVRQSDLAAALSLPQVVRVALRLGNLPIASAEGMTVQITLDKPVDKDDYYIQPWRFRHTRGKHKSHQTYPHKPQIRSGFRKQDLGYYGCNLPIDKLKIPQNTTVFTIDTPLSRYAKVFRARAGVKDKGNDFWKCDYSARWKFSVCRYGSNVPHKPEKGAGYADTGALPSAQTLIVVTPPPRRDETKPRNLAAYIE